MLHKKKKKTSKGIKLTSKSNFHKTKKSMVMLKQQQPYFNTVYWCEFFGEKFNKISQ